jgi:hypothetical protein
VRMRSVRMEAERAGGNDCLRATRHAGFVELTTNLLELAPPHGPSSRHSPGSDPSTTFPGSPRPPPEPRGPCAHGLPCSLVTARRRCPAPPAQSCIGPKRHIGKSHPPRARNASPTPASGPERQPDPRSGYGTPASPSLWMPSACLTIEVGMQPSPPLAEETDSQSHRCSRYGTPTHTRHGAPASPSQWRRNASLTLASGTGPQPRAGGG